MTLDDLVVTQRIERIRELGLDGELILAGLDCRVPPSVEQINASFDYITNELGLDAKVFEKLPTLFNYSIEDNLKPKVKYITKTLGLDKKVLEKGIAIWSTSQEVLQEKVNYITKTLELDLKVFEKFPALFGYSIEDNLKPKVEYIIKTLGLNIKVFKKFPQLFSLSTEDNLKPKVEYITKELGYDIGVFEKLPALFSYSLKKRIMPRVEFLAKKGKTDQLLKHIREGDAYFCEKNAKCSRSEYDAFKEDFIRNYDAASSDEYDVRQVLVEV